jgi:hypothetical protein
VKPKSASRRTSLRPGSRKSPEAPGEAGSAFIDTALPLDEMIQRLEFRLVDRRVSALRTRSSSRTAFKAAARPAAEHKITEAFARRKIKTD